MNMEDKVQCPYYYDIRCPYCNIVNRVRLSEGDHILSCYPGEGGCDELFAVVIKFQPECKVFKLVEATYESSQK